MEIFFYTRQLKKKKSFLTALVEFSNGDTDNCTGVVFVINYLILNCNQFGFSEISILLVRHSKEYT